ncbi:uncharacterized protein [Centruroides vittatus]|uniref:uncharacterized protein n=1 Tax=Centruroides vittatus TaxID=120091 RepID=UPI0035108314
MFVSLKKKKNYDSGPREFKEKVISVINRNTKCNDSVDEWWTQVAREIRRIAKELLGETKPVRKIEKEVWWWNEEVKKAIREKKDAFKSWQNEKGDNKVREEKRVVYVQMKKKAKTVVAIAKAQAQDEMYGSLTGKEGRKAIYRLAKMRDRGSKDMSYIKCIKDTNGKVLTKNEEIKAR